MDMAYVLITFSLFIIGDYNTKLRDRDRVISLRTKSKEYPFTVRSTQNNTLIYTGGGGTSVEIFSQY